MTTRSAETHGKMRSVLLLVLGGKGIVYEGNGEQTLNPEGDLEIFRMSALDGSGKKNLSNNGLNIYDGIYPD